MRKRNSSARGLAAGAGLLGLVALSLGTPDACGGMTDAELVGPNGGLVRSADGRLTLEIPADALSSEVEISVHVIECEQDDQAACYEVRPEGIAFQFPAAATFEAAELMAMDSVALNVKGASGWQPMADMVRDEDDETVTASLLYSSSISVQAQ